MTDDPEFPPRKRRPKRLKRVLRLSIPRTTKLSSLLVTERLLCVLDFTSMIPPLLLQSYRLNLVALADRLTHLPREAECIASVPTRASIDTSSMTQTFTEAGWTPYAFSADDVELELKEKRSSSYDCFVAAITAIEVIRYEPTALALCTADVGTILAVGDALKAAGIAIPMVTLSMIGSQAHRLNPVLSKRVADRLTIGLDCLTPLSDDALPFTEIRVLK